MLSSIILIQVKHSSSARWMTSNTLLQLQLGNYIIIMYNTCVVRYIHVHISCIVVSSWLCIHVLLCHHTLSMYCSLVGYVIMQVTSCNSNVLDLSRDVICYIIETCVLHVCRHFLSVASCH